MDAIRNHPANGGVIRWLCRESGGVASVAAPDSAPDPYNWCGSHPEIVERVWDQLGHGLPPNCRVILCGTPVLVEPTTGVILAVSFGTSYCLRLPEGALPAALKAGCKTSRRWTGGTFTDVSTLFGLDWVFGCWAKDEVAWCRAVAASTPPA
jgi:hypothetical protein